MTGKRLFLIVRISSCQFSSCFHLYRTTFDHHAPQKQRYSRSNHIPFVNKIFSKDIMKHSKIRKCLQNIGLKKTKKNIPHSETTVLLFYEKPNENILAI